MLFLSGTGTDTGVKRAAVSCNCTGRVEIKRAGNTAGTSFERLLNCANNTAPTSTKYMFGGER